MKKETTKTTTETTALIEVIKNLLPSQKVDYKAFPNFKKDIKTVHNAVYKVYCDRQQGTATAENESQAMQTITTFLHTLGKANGKYISVMERTTGKDGKTSVLFETLVYNSFKHTKFATSEKLASLLADRKQASQAKKTAHSDFINGKGTAKAYKEACTKFDEIATAIQAEKSKQGSEKNAKIKDNDGAFLNLLVLELQEIANKRYALTAEEAEIQRKLYNKEKREAKKAKAKAEPKSKATAEKKTTKKSKAKAEPKTAEQKTA